MADKVFAGPWLEFEKELGHRPLLHGPKVEDCFAGWDRLGASLFSKFTFPAPDASVGTEDRKIEGIKIRIYTPPGNTDGKPIGIYIHGGGMCMGDLESDDAGCRVIAKGATVTIVSVDYRLAPAHPYPAGLDDCVAVAKWVLEHRRPLGGSPSIFVAGASAGGGAALGVALRLIDAGLGNKLVGVVSQVPVTVHPDLVPEDLKAGYTSYDENAEYTVNSKSAMYAFHDAYGKPKDAYANPLLSSELKKLPKVYLTAAGTDTLRDDARLMRQALEQNGVKVKYDEYPGYPHYFWTFPSAALKEVADVYNTNLVEGVKFVLS